MDNEKQSKQINIYSCIECGFTTQLKCNYKSHLTTAKHIRVTSGNIKPIIQFICNCGKEYKNRHTLSRHRKNCRITTTEPEPANINMTMILDIIKENQEIKNLLLEQNRQVIELHKENNILNKDNNMLMNKLVEREPGNNNNNTTNNNINQKFNLNFFLNETCKDAMNIQEFLENIRITFQDLLMIGNSGFVNGVSDIFIKQLRDLEITKRPLHCTDIKRETIHFKEDDIWNKDNTENSKLKNIISKVEYKNVVALKQWCNENPDAFVNNTDNNLLKDKIYLQTLQGDERSREKIIKNISKEIIIDKEQEI
jgi:hypothetical protein